MSYKQKFLESIFGFRGGSIGLNVPGHSVVRLSLLAAGVIALGGCAAYADNAIVVSLDKDIQLRIGQSALVGAEKLQVGFLEVTSDSRCGTGEVCVWEGDAIVRIWLQMAGETRQEQELHTASSEVNAADYAGYGVVLLSLSPAPVSGRTIAPSEYIVTLQVTHGFAGDSNIY